jgi:hypothetical protein
VSAVALAGVRGLFVEARPRAVAGSIPPLAPPPTVAVLCTPARGHAAAASVALALARAAGRRCAIAAAAGASTRALPALPATAAAARAARRLRERGQSATASGRLVRLVAPPVPDRDADAAGIAAGASAALARAAIATCAPAVLAIPFARVEGLDRVLGWHDGIVVVREPGAPEGLVERALESLAALGRPVAAIAPPAGAAALAATLGLRAHDSALAAVAELGLVDEASRRR